MNLATTNENIVFQSHFCKFTYF